MRFEPEGAGTRLTLIHRGGEHQGEAGQAERNSYDRGAEAVLKVYGAAAGR